VGKLTITMSGDPQADLRQKVDSKRKHTIISRTTKKGGDPSQLGRWPVLDSDGCHGEFKICCRRVGLGYARSGKAGGALWVSS